MSEAKPTWQRPVLLAAAGSTYSKELRSAIRWALTVIDTQRAEIERLRVYEVCTGQPDCMCYAHQRDALAECRRLLREAVAMLDTTDDSDQTQVDWLEAARKAAGGE